jgi:hypothetical protein
VGKKNFWWFILNKSQQMMVWLEEKTADDLVSRLSSCDFFSSRVLAPQL